MHTGLDEWVSQQALWRHHNERFAEVPVQLTPEHVKVIARRSDVHDLPVDVAQGVELALVPIT
jgi:hypothetical protein